MATYRDTPYSSYNYLVDLGVNPPDSILGGFSEVSLPEMSLDVIEYRLGNSKENTSIKLPGLTRYTNLVLKRGLVGSLDLFEWISQAAAGDSSARRTVRVILLDEQHNPAMTWIFSQAFPVSYSFSDLQANTSQVLVERLELVVGGMRME
jgi:phage tail-like protein